MTYLIESNHEQCSFPFLIIENSGPHHVIGGATSQAYAELFTAALDWQTFLPNVAALRRLADAVARGEDVEALREMARALVG